MLQGTSVMMAGGKNSGSFEALPADLIQRIAASIPSSSDAEARRWALLLHVYITSKLSTVVDNVFTALWLLVRDHNCLVQV